MEPAAGAGAADANNEKVAQVLQLAVRHVEDTQTATSMCQLSQACRRAMQQATGKLSVSLRVSANSLPAVAGFAAWLPQYPGLVRELVVNTSQPDPSRSEVLAAEQLVAQALQLCAERSSRPVLAKPALQLRRFDTNLIFNAAALGSLAACRDLAELRLERVPKDKLTAAVCGALAGLTSLTQLTCTLRTRPTVPDCFPNALARLPQLQDLVISGKMSLSGVAQLPSSLTELDLLVDDNTEGASLNLSHLSWLQTLNLSVTGASMQAQLPVGLLELAVYFGAIAGVCGAQLLQHLYLEKARLGLPLLGQLRALPSLRKLTGGLHGCSTQQLEQVTTSIGAATQLTALQLYNKECDAEVKGDVLDCSAVRLHPHLCKLRHLQELVLVQIGLGADDAVHLTGLAPLTRLTLGDCRIDDLSLVAMLQQQTALRELDVYDAPLSSPAVWVVLRSLTTLQRLDWRGNGLVLADHTLHLLSPLTGLTSFITDRGEQQSVSAAAEREFLERMPHLCSIYWG